MYVVFWGAGHIGHEMIQYWKFFGIKPDCICDNSAENWGTLIDDIPIVNPASLVHKSDLLIVVTCNAYNIIKRQIESMNYDDVVVIEGTSSHSFEMLFYLYKWGNRYKNIKKTKINSDKFVIDFQYGTTLGGVQTWSYSQAEILKKIGFTGYYLMPDNYLSMSPNNYFESVIIKPNEVTKFDNYIDVFVEKLINIAPKYIIINFPREILFAAAVVKKYFIPNIKIIAVVHNDEQIYYDTYGDFKDYIDKVIVISSRMSEKLVKKGISENKIRKIQWKVSISDTYSRKYGNESIRLGYAGRISIQQKRVDLLLEVAKKLKERKIKFVLDIAGVGESEEYVNSTITDLGLEQYVFMKGLVSHARIHEFWEKHDIYLSCSDFEGHSISQYEAMACGVIPIVTDVSGAEDDITHEYNGFISAVGDVESMVQYIEYISNNMQVLPIMANRSIKMISDRNSQIDEKELWRELTNDV